MNWQAVSPPAFAEGELNYGIQVHHALGQWYVNSTETMWRTETLDGSWTPVWVADDLGLSAAVVTDMIEFGGQAIAVGRKSQGPLTGQTPGPPLGPSVSYMDAAAWRSSDGMHWDPMDVPLVPPGDAVSESAPVRSTMRAVASHDGQLVAVGEQRDVGTALVWRSADGASWQLATGFPIGSRGCPQICADETGHGNGPGSADGVAWFDGAWYVVGSTQPHPNNSAIWTSEDGIQWSELAIPSELQRADDYQKLSMLAVGPHGLVASADLGPEGWGLVVSGDGKNWRIVGGVGPRTIVAYDEGFIGWSTNWSWTPP